ncbi:hypothetical protein [Clostridioides difficile]|uniref:Uncharacterized protein n=2 Tax=Clostridioides difficile TaxID=1496 RepID=A0AAX3GZK4_CLODI|nr:hypothetical protein [Clostridioides difficile]AXU66864.1 hypothetical protein CDIF29020_00526 [Clostridioides difficile]EFH08851.1 hypothetical protein HMPREF0220_0256 [Clostridioides difficile NAP08]EFH13987.1 hypothetical protein HMPREF0219_3272 [Clostridioides difficile NAP07]EGT2240102.1 hypothetical protein [Clostridioides difficile]EGT3720028.1 hypothetical protein [Clostridioides difficile]
MKKRFYKVFLKTIPNLIIVILSLALSFYTNTFDIYLKILLLIPLAYVLLFIYYYIKTKKD